MKNPDSIKRSALMFLCVAFLLMCVGASRAAAQTVYLVCTWDTSSVYKQKDGKEKFERRFYVTDLVQTTRDVYVAVKKVVPQIEDSCGDYIQRTVYKAATERGERLESGTLKVLKNIDTTADGMDYKFAPKEEVEKNRAEMIREAQSFGRQILTFNWDMTYGSEAADLAREQKRVPPTMAVAAAPQTAQTTTSSNVQATNKNTAGANYIFGWARVVTTVQDLDKNFSNSINRAYYSNIVALPTNADASALKGQVAAYFNQLGIPNAMKVNEKVQVKDVVVKTFPTLHEADTARYNMATADRDKLNANATTEVALPVSYFTWNYYGSRRDLFPDIGEFTTTGYLPQWEFAIFAVRVEKQVGGQTVHETRHYVSYPYELFMTGSESIRRKKHLDSYFMKTVIEPAAARGLKISYYDSDIEIFPYSSNYNTFAEAWAERAERLDVIKSREDPQYDFLVISNGPNKGEATSFPFCAMGCTGERARITSLEARPATTKQ